MFGKHSTLTRALLLGSLGLASAGCATRHSEVGIGLRFGEPPAIRREVVYASPGPNYVWLPGYWAGSGRGYYWVAGRWTRPPRARAVWVEPRWERRNQGWFFIRGRWRY
jgi:hypothetical protein